MRNKYVSTTQKKKQSLKTMGYTRKCIKINEIYGKKVLEWGGGGRVIK